MKQILIALCLALNAANAATPREIVQATLICESGGRPEKEMICVMEVIRNRSQKSGKSFDAICLQKGQFIEWNNGRIEETVNRAKKHPKFNKAANLISTKTDFTRGATHFYSTNIAAPKWTKKMKQTAVIGAFKFYKE